MIFIDSCYGRPTPRPAVWFMRQAGRYLPEYRAIRAENTFLEMCANPDLVQEVTLQPIRRFGMDAAIIFADILLPLVPMGLELRFAKGEGPVIDNPVRTAADVAKLKMPDTRKDFDFLYQALQKTRAALDKDKALIGFAGAPFTVACYAHKGCGGNFEVMRQWMFRDPAVFEAMMVMLTDVTIEYLRLQAEAGANALMIFDSWGGQLSGYDYLDRIFPHVQRLLGSLKDLNVPRILFVKNANHYRDFLRIADAEVIGLDWTMPLAESREILGPAKAVQGNLDPMLLFTDPETVRRRTLAMLELNNRQPGYIANLGHGINKDTPIENVAAFVETVKNFS